MLKKMLQKKFARARDSNPNPSEQKSWAQPPPIAPTGTFARAIMVEAPGYVATRSVNCAISLMVHFGTILVLLAVPVFFSGEPRLVAFNSPELVTVPLPAPKEPLGFHSHTAFERENLRFSSVKLVAPVFNKRFLSAPAVIPPGDPLKIGPLGMHSGFGDVLGGILSQASSPLLMPVTPEAARFVPIGGDVKESRLVSNVTLAYPELAKIAHIFGRVVIEAVIDETGKVTNVRALSGPMLLTTAAIEAISRERFQPLLLNGLPTRCGLLVRVSFRLHESEPEPD
jgi:TonB family protein